VSCKPSCPACHITFTWRTIAWVINQGFVEAFKQSLTQTDKQSVKTINSCKLELLQSCTSHTHPSRESLLSLSGQANQVRVTVAQQNPQLTELPAVTVTEHACHIIKRQLHKHCQHHLKQVHTVLTCTFMMRLSFLLPCPKTSTPACCRWAVRVRVFRVGYPEGLPGPVLVPASTYTDQY